MPWHKIVDAEIIALRDDRGCKGLDELRSRRRTSQLNLNKHFEIELGEDTEETGVNGIHVAAHRDVPSLFDNDRPHC